MRTKNSNVCGARVCGEAREGEERDGERVDKERQTQRRGEGSALSIYLPRSLKPGTKTKNT